MVVITISMLLVVGVVVSMNQYYGREKMNQASSRLVSLLELARTYAITNQHPSSLAEMDYVAVTLTANGTVAATPVNRISGSGPSYFSENVYPGVEVITTPLNFGSLNFAVGSGKLVGKDPAPSFASYPLPAAASVGITLTTAENNPDNQQIVVSAFGGINSNYVDN